jgi:hypothetical protein
MTIQLDLSVDEVNGVLVALSQLPFGQVEPLINKVRQQAAPQVEALKATETTEA